MHTLAVQLAPVLADKSKAPFYAAGGVLVAWALLVALGIGLRRSDFPATLTQQRVVMAISVVLVLGAVSTAVITSGGETKSSAAEPGAQPSRTGSPPAEGSESAGAGTSSTKAETATTAPSTTETTSTAPASTSKSAPAQPAQAPLKLAAEPSGQLSFTTKSLSARAGKVTISFSNASPLEHNVTIAQGSRVLGATPTFLGGSRTLTVNLAPGTYTFYCSVPGHRQAGMEGTLKVS
jgi:plastocyanin